VSSRSRVRWALEANWAAPVRKQISQGEAQRETQFLRTVESETRFHALPLREFAAAMGESREKFFILGSSASVEELTSASFDEIRSGTSVGINAWALHSFVPDIYAYEPVPNPDSDHFSTLSYLNRTEVTSRSPMTLILRPRNPIEASQLEQIPSKLRKGTFLYGRISPYTRQEKNLRKDLPTLLRFLKKNRGPIITIDSGATIVRMASLAILMGFKKVIFVGVDLKDTRYFWQVNPSYLDRLGISSFDSEQKWQVHETEMEGFAPFVASTMIRELSTVAERHFGTSFFATSETSRLAKFLPQYHLPTG